MKLKPASSSRHSRPKSRACPKSRGALKLETIPIRDLLPIPNNSRLHPAKQIEKLCRAVEEFGFLIPVLIDERNRIIAGHRAAFGAQGAVRHCGVPPELSFLISVVERRVTPLEIAADRTDQLSWPKHKSADRDRRGIMMFSCAAIPCGIAKLMIAVETDQPWR
jgi:hypothetical protein